MAEDGTPASLLRLRARARELEDAIARSNAPLPDELSVERLTTLTQGLRELDEAESEDSLRMLVNTRRVFREARDDLRSAAGDDGDSPHYSVERALKDAALEVADLLEPVSKGQLITLQPPPGSPPLIVRRDDAAIIGKLDALVERVAGLERQAAQAARQAGPIIVAETVNHYELNLIKELKVNLDSLIKNTISLSAELRAQLVDLEWVAQLTERVGKLAEALKGGADALKRIGSELADILKQVGRVHRLAGRVVSGGAALYRFIMRVLGSSTPSEQLPDLRPEALPDLAAFRDRTDLPEMVIIPAGTFLMGSPEDDEEGIDDERPRHEVRISYRFALGRYPVTFAEYDAFCEATGREKPGDVGWGRGRRPVINVSWHDARAYCDWLSRETGAVYRLASEAEWEYACRAGTATRYWWGDAITLEQANYGSNVYRTTVVGDYTQNLWNISDMHGNVWEWCEDVWHEDYAGAPLDGSAWLMDGEPPIRIMRGGSWLDDSGRPRAAVRTRFPPGLRFPFAGFRVARVLNA